MRTQTYKFEGYEFDLHDYGVCMSMTVRDSDGEIAVTDELADRDAATDWVSGFLTGLRNARHELQHFALPPACYLIAADILGDPARKAGTIAAIQEAA